MVRERLQNLLKEKKLTQISVAKKAGINPKIFNMMLNGRVRIPADTLVTICEKGLGISPSFFFRKTIQ